MTGHAGPLAGLRVLEIPVHAAVPLGGLTLAGLGAEVIRIDPAGGDAATGRRPAEEPDGCTAWTGPPEGHRSLALNLRSARGRTIVTELLAASGPRGGIVLTCTAGPTWLSHAELARRRSDLIYLQVEHRPDRSAEVDGDINAATGLLLGGELERRPWPLHHLLPAWDVAYGLHAAMDLLGADRHRQHTGQGRAIKLALEDVTHAVAGHLGMLAEAQLSRVHRVRIGGYVYGGFARDFATADRERVIVAILTRRQFADLVKITRLAGTFAFLERLLDADFSACGDRYTHQESIASMLASWFARRTVADLTAAFAGTSVPWERLPSRPGRAPRAASSHPGRRLAAVGTSTGTRWRRSYSGAVPRGSHSAFFADGGVYNSDGFKGEAEGPGQRPELVLRQHAWPAGG